jgi:thiosulfate reductase cytochrome b subunit
LAEISPETTPTLAPGSRAKEVICRHRLTTRLTHWVNVVCFTILLMSGLQILNAHPSLYWGQFGADDDHAFIQFYAARDGDDLIGRTRIGALTVTTTGLIGATPAPTLPSFRDLATGRRWHFFFAWLFVINGLVYVGASLINGHFQRDLVPSRRELRPRHILRDLWNHARLKFPKGEAAKKYSVLQKVAYLGVAVLLALMVLTGLTMSPGFNAVLPEMVDLFGGRQSARTIHFISAVLVVAFIVIHLAMVLLAGPINEIHSMITGRYAVPPEDGQ